MGTLLKTNVSNMPMFYRDNVQEAHHHQEDQLEVHLTSLVVSAAVDQESNSPASSSPVSLFQALLNLNHHHKHHQATKQNQPKNLTTKKKNLKRRKKKSKLAIYLNQFYV